VNLLKESELIETEILRKKDFKDIIFNKWINVSEHFSRNYIKHPLLYVVTYKIKSSAVEMPQFLSSFVTLSSNSPKWNLGETPRDSVKFWPVFPSKSEFTTSLGSVSSLSMYVLPINTFEWFDVPKKLALHGISTFNGKVLIKGKPIGDA
jgi:hypothetical protein